VVVAPIRVIEQQYVWRKSWLLAGHIDEVPVPGVFRLWETAGAAGGDRAIECVRDIRSRHVGAEKAFYLHGLNRGVLVPGTRRWWWDRLCN
jgi:hypothetical protein